VLAVEVQAQPLRLWRRESILRNETAEPGIFTETGTTVEPIPIVVRNNRHPRRAQRKRLASTLKKVTRHGGTLADEPLASCG